MRINSKILSTIFHTNKEEINKYCSHLLKKKNKLLIYKRTRER